MAEIKCGTLRRGEEIKEEKRGNFNSVRKEVVTFTLH
jgi:hypothetical protein